MPKRVVHSSLYLEKTYTGYLKYIVYSRKFDFVLLLLKPTTYIE